MMKNKLYLLTLLLAIGTTSQLFCMKKFMNGALSVLEQIGEALDPSTPIQTQAPQIPATAPQPAQPSEPYPGCNFFFVDQGGQITNRPVIHNGKVGVQFNNGTIYWENAQQLPNGQWQAQIGRKKIAYPLTNPLTPLNVYDPRLANRTYPYFTIDPVNEAAPTGLAAVCLYGTEGNRATETGHTHIAGVPLETGYEVVMAPSKLRDIMINGTLPETVTAFHAGTGRTRVLYLVNGAYTIQRPPLSVPFPTPTNPTGISRELENHIESLRRDNDQQRIQAAQLRLYRQQQLPMLSQQWQQQQ